MSGPENLRWEEVLAADQPRAADYLAARSGLSGMQMKRLMQAGGVWLFRPRQPGKRLRRATAALCAGDRVQVCFDAKLLATRVPPATLLEDAGCFSVWFKPAGMVSQGNEWGDHLSLLRQVELHFAPRRPVFLIHRLDREALGLMVVAHHRGAAADLSRQWQLRTTLKRYRALVRGLPGSVQGEIRTALDGKPAVTSWRLLRGDSEPGCSLLEVTIETGRKHQIRRHLALAGLPVMGDPRHGHDNRNTTGLALAAVELGFTHPQTGAALCYRSPEELLPAELTLLPGDQSAPVGAAGPGVAGPGVAGPGVAGPGVAGPGVGGQGAGGQGAAGQGGDTPVAPRALPAGRDEQGTMTASTRREHHRG